MVALKPLPLHGAMSGTLGLPLRASPWSMMPSAMNLHSHHWSYRMGHLEGEWDVSPSGRSRVRQPGKEPQSGNVEGPGAGCGWSCVPVCPQALPVVQGFFILVRGLEAFIHLGEGGRELEQRLCQDLVRSLLVQSPNCPWVAQTRGGPDLGEDCVLACRVPRGASPVLHGEAPVDVEAWHEAGLAAL